MQHVLAPLRTVRRAGDHAAPPMIHRRGQTVRLGDHRACATAQTGQVWWVKGRQEVAMPDRSRGSTTHRR
jgi:hypothetical protein